MHLGKKIKGYLDDNGISQTFIAEKSGISIVTLNQMLNGGRNIRAEEYFLICDALGVSLSLFKQN